MFRRLILATALAALTTPAFADTLKVPQDFETIQAAVDAAAEDDTIAISSGQYTENVVVPPAKDGLTITGKGKVFINAQGVPDDDGGGAGDGIEIQSNNVTVSKLTIRHANDAGIRAGLVTEDGPPPPLTGITIDKVVIINSNNAGIDLVADDCTVKSCTLFGNGDGLQNDGDNASVTKTRVSNDCDAGIDIEGDDALVDGCTVSTIEDGGGVDISGERATVKKCNVSIVDGDGISIDSGSGHLVESNRVETTDSSGIDVDGDNSVVQKNAVDSPCSSGIDVYGSGLVVASNTVTNVPDDEDGIYVDGPGAPEKDGGGSGGSVGSTIEKNKVIGAQEDGYNLSVADSTISKNLAQACSGEDEDGFNIEGNGNTIEKNTAKGCDDTGFEIRGDDNLILKNKSSDNTDNGIFISGVDSTANVLEGNNVSNNFGDGIQNQGTGTVIRKNKLKGNMQDLSNETLNGANYVDDGGNNFSTGGLDAEPIVD